MAKRPQFEPIETRKGWMVSIPGMMSGAGERSRKYFPKEKDAKSFAKTLLAQYHRGERGGVIPHALALMAAEADRMLQPFGMTILDAAKAIAEKQRHEGRAETFQERYDRFYAANEGHWRERYRNDMEKLPRWVGTAFMQMPCAGMNEGVIEAALKEHGAGSLSTVIARKTRVLAVLHAKAKKPRGGVIKIMSAHQCAKMLRSCQSPAERRAVALLLFAGIRPYAEGGNGELGRIDWQDVGSDHITVHPEASKTGTDRLIPITPRLKRLLSGHPSSGTVVPPNWQRRAQAIRKAAGVAGEQDITRHTFASNYLAAFGEDATKSAMGHTANSQTLFRHYRRAVTKEAGEKYFSHREPLKKRHRTIKRDALQRHEETSRADAEETSSGTGQDDASGRRTQGKVARRQPGRGSQAEARVSTTGA